jgi:hypothetical protein
MAGLLPARAAMMLDTVAADAVDATSSRAPLAFFKELVVIASTTSTGLLADAGVPTTEVDMAGMLTARAALMLDTAGADAVDAASSRAPGAFIEELVVIASMTSTGLGTIINLVSHIWTRSACSSENLDLLS